VARRDRVTDADADADDGDTVTDSFPREAPEAADPAAEPATVPPRPHGTVAPRPERRRLTHLDRSGRPRMVDVSAKPATVRRAVAEAFVTLSPETLSLVIDGGNEKGDVLGVAELAGVMGGKRTSDLIPLCHPLPLTDLVVAVTPDRAGGGLRIRAEAATIGPTGVEMEALTAASVAALTVYDMVKGVEREVEISSVRLILKSGGKSGEWERGQSVPSRGPRRPGPRNAGRVGGGRRRSP